MENSNAQKIIKKLQAEIATNGIVVELLIPELKKLREFALVEQKPFLVKALRLAYEHLEEHQDFLVKIPADEPLEEEVETDATRSNIESLDYFLSLMLDVENKHNVADLREYNQQFLSF